MRQLSLYILYYMPTRFAGIWQITYYTYIVMSLIVFTSPPCHFLHDLFVGLPASSSSSSDQSADLITLSTDRSRLAPRRPNLPSYLQHYFLGLENTKHVSDGRQILNGRCAGMTPLPAKDALTETTNQEPWSTTSHRTPRFALREDQPAYPAGSLQSLSEGWHQMLDWS